MEEPRNEEPNEWDQERADFLIGKHVLIGITWTDLDEKPIRREQKHGEITRVDRGHSVTIRLDNGELFSLPPALYMFEDAAPGLYRLKETGEEIQDPDLLCTIKMWNNPIN